MTEAQNRANIIALCKKYVGTKENPAGSNNVIFNTRFYGREVRDGFDLKGRSNKDCKYPWCGTSVSEIYQENNTPLGTIDYLRGFASCPNAIRFLKEGRRKWGKIIELSQALPADIVFVDFNKDGNFDHTGIIEKLELLNGKIWVHTYEGNTSRDEKGSQSNGGEFCGKTRDPQRTNLLIVRPNAILATLKIT